MFLLAALAHEVFVCQQDWICKFQGQEVALCSQPHQPGIPAKLFRGKLQRLAVLSHRTRHKCHLCPADNGTGGLGPWGAPNIYHVPESICDTPGTVSSRCSAQLMRQLPQTHFDGRSVREAKHANVTVAWQVCAPGLSDSAAKRIATRFCRTASKTTSSSACGIKISSGYHGCLRLSMTCSTKSFKLSWAKRSSSPSFCTTAIITSWAKEFVKMPLRIGHPQW